MIWSEEEANEWKKVGSRNWFSSHFPVLMSLDFIPSRSLTRNFFFHRAKMALPRKMIEMIVRLRMDDTSAMRTYCADQV